MAQKLFASFLLDRESGLEIALQAEKVTEATGICGTIMPLPESLDFFEGIMNLRDEIIPIVNLKKRLSLPQTTYDKNAKIAVIMIANIRCGLLFDDIKEVLRVENDSLRPINSVVLSPDPIITSLIKLKNNRTLEVLELESLFTGYEEIIKETTIYENKLSQNLQQKVGDETRYVIFQCRGQDYGIPVEHSREITFYTDIDDTYRNNESVEGALQLRGQTIPILNAHILIAGHRDPQEVLEGSRILVISIEDISFGIIADKIQEILAIPDNQVLSMPNQIEEIVSGIYQHPGGSNVMLLNVSGLVASQSGQLRSIGRIGKYVRADAEDSSADISRHLITENCYLIVSIEKPFAIEIKDIQEIIEYRQVMDIPAAGGFNSGVINLRGQILPVVNLRRFYNFPELEQGHNNARLIICRGNKKTVALAVDGITTIYKQEQYYNTPSIKAQYQERKDTLDRLIEYVDEEGIGKHVLVLNLHNLIQNHLHYDDKLSKEAMVLNDNEAIVSKDN